MVSTQEALRVALQHHQAGRLEDAGAIYNQILEREPGNAYVLYLLGLVAQRKGRFEEALALLSKSVGINPLVAEYHNSLGEACRALGQLEQALSNFRKAITLRPEYPEAYYNLGNALRDQGRLEEAIAALRWSTQLRADFADAWNDLGLAFESQCNFHEALAAFKKALELNPVSAGVLDNLGAVLTEMERYDEAIAAHRRAIQMQPDLANAHNNLGVALGEKGLLDEALAAFRRAIELREDFAEAHMNAAGFLLHLTDFSKGLEEFEWRWRCRVVTSPRRNFAQPLWNGSATVGRTILVHTEQGLGDAIQFVRYVPLLGGRRRAKVILECQPELKALFQCIGSVQQIVTRGDPLPDFDMQIPVMSLPRAFGTTLETIPADVPYLRPEPARVNAWQGRIATDRRTLRVGLIWAATPWNAQLRKRTPPRAALTPLAELTGVRFYSLQKGKDSEEARNPPPGLSLIDLTGELNDFADTAAFMASLDLVIAVDSPVAHLAGAMAKPVWTLLKFMPDWRWFLDREDSPWYPTMRLFRQPSPGDWASVIRRVADELQKLVRARSTFERL